MRITSDRISVLLGHGLSEYQARVYLALLEFPSLTAGVLAKTAQIPRNRLYEVLEDLQGLGLVEILLEETRKYRAKPLSNYLDRQVQELRERIAEIDSRKEYLALAFQPPSPEDLHELEFGSTRVVLGRRAVAREVDRIVDEAKESIVASASPGGWGRVLRHVSKHALADEPANVDEAASDGAEPVGRSPERGRIHLEIYLPRSVAGSGGVERFGEALASSVRFIDSPLGSLTFIVDSRELLLVQPIPDDDRLRAGHDFALLSTNPVFVRDQLELLRRAASPPAQAADVVRSEPPVAQRS